MIHDPLCPYRPVKWHGWMQYDKEIPCQCNFIRRIRVDERMSCIKDVEGAYIDSDDMTASWNAAISVAIEYLKGLD